VQLPLQAYALGRGGLDRRRARLAELPGQGGGMQGYGQRRTDQLDRAAIGLVQHVLPMPQLQIREEPGHSADRSAAPFTTRIPTIAMV